MKLVCLALAVLVGLGSLSGCANFGETKVSMPYVSTMDRTDQKIDGNRGYVKGTPPPPEDKTGRKRPFITIDVDLPRSSKEAGIEETRLVGSSGTKNTSSGNESASVKMEDVK